MNLEIATLQDIERLIADLKSELSAQEPDQTLTLEEAAHLLKMGKGVLSEMAKRGKIPCRDVGLSGRQCFRFSKNALSRWLDGR